MIENNVEDDIQSSTVGRIDQLTEFVISVCRSVRKARVRMQKVVDSIAMIGLLKGEIFEHGTQPDGSGSQTFDIGELGLYTRKLAPLKFREGGIVKGCMVGRR